MVREDILGGLNSALARGQSLRQAMMSFYNAGYLKEEIEAAAKFLKSGTQITQPQIQSNQSPLQVSKPKEEKGETKQIVSSYETDLNHGEKLQLEKPDKKQKKAQLSSVVGVQNQNVSQYGKPAQNPKGKLVIAILGVVLFFLLISFAAVFFFRQEIISFFSSN